MSENRYVVTDAFHLPQRKPIVIQLDREMDILYDPPRHIAKIGEDEYPYLLNHNLYWITLKSESGFGDISRFVGQTVELL